ncbi:hypothetical protein [Micromonospora sp. NPDC005220]|uniref:hypothetical protein n=1 Tax=Micromonospora sp. NPDC005220 TaxID=3155589 RepID=UPI0033A91C9B
MPGARTAVTALVTLTIVDVFHTIVALAAYEHRIGVVTHDGSGTADMLNAIVPLRELSAVMLCLLLLTPLTAWAGVANWVTRARNSGPPVAPPAPVKSWWISATIAASLNLIATVALVTTTAAGIQVVRRTQANQQQKVVAGAATA